MDPTFYRSPSQAIQAPPEELAYAVAFDRTGQRPDALTVIDVDPGSAEYGRVVGGPTCRPSATSCTTSAGTPAPAR
jgi:selenium-binding protein 1